MVGSSEIQMESAVSRLDLGVVDVVGGMRRRYYELHLLLNNGSV